MKIRIPCLLFFLLVIAGCSTTGQRETAPQNMAEAPRIIVPETFFEPLTRAVIQAYLDSDLHVSDKYWWLDCPGLGAVLRSDDVFTKEELQSSRQCMKKDTHRQFALELRRAIRIGGPHYGRAVWDYVETAVAQYDNLEQFLVKTKMYYWDCEAVDIPANGVISGLDGKRIVTHAPVPPAKSGKLYDCGFPLYTKMPIYMRLAMMKDFADLLDIHAVTKPTFLKWTVRVYSPDKKSPLMLIDSAAVGRQLTDIHGGE